MIFGKIDYLNLLPFHVYLKQAALPTYVKKAIEYKKGIPSHINKLLQKRRIDGAIISSIESKRAGYKNLNLGISAKREVKSVLVRKNSAKKLDKASQSSNMLSKILNKEGEVLIGDRALKAYLSEGKENFYDLAQLWYEKTSLPFAFARFSCTKNYKSYKKLVKNFAKKPYKIPDYILEKYSLSRDISKEDIKDYLKFIHYNFAKKEEVALNKFFKEARALNFNPN